MKDSQIKTHVLVYLFLVPILFTFCTHIIAAEHFTLQLSSERTIHNVSIDKVEQAINDPKTFINSLPILSFGEIKPLKGEKPNFFSFRDPFFTS